MKRQLALVTGASSGIGKEIARLLAEKGYDLLLVSRNKDRLSATRKELQKEGVMVSAIAIDLSLPGAEEKVFSFTRSKGMDVDILVNNAGFGVYGQHVKSDISRVGSMLNLNILSLTGLCRLYGSEMKRRRRGRILNIASTAAFQPTPSFAAYGASKSYVLNFSEALAKELEDHGVTVTCLSPGATQTDFFRVARGVHHVKPLASFPRMSPEMVAQVGIDALFRGRLDAVPGFRNKFLIFLVRLFPRTMVARISKNMMYKR
ncbi:MAG: SDR family oxidoreductase [DPANN group archaeon]|nr:SDR family oxidoreductase [DPANN group archaeon]